MSLTPPARTLLMLVLAVLAAAPGLVACSEEEPAEGSPSGSSTATYDAPAFAEKMAAPGTVLLDVRTPEEFEAGHIEGARNLPLSASDFEEQVAALDKGSTYAVYCRTDSRSGEAMVVMAEHGIEDVYDLEGGMEAWQDYGGAVVTGG